MLKFKNEVTTQIFKFIAFVLFWIGIFTVNSTCELIFHQSEEPLSLKRFCRK